MDSTTLWSGPRRHSYSPTIGSTNVHSQNGVVVNSAFSSGELQRSNSAATQLTTKNAKMLNLRPCVAGTQTVQHQLAKHAIAPLLVNMDNESGSFTDVTQDSSGFGSFANTEAYIDSSAGKLDDEPQVHRNNSEKQSSKNDADGLSSKTGDLDGTNNCPGDECDFSERKNTEKITSISEMSPNRGYDNRNDSRLNESEFVINDVNSAFHLVSGRQSRMLEENLASVARYVEELTGCTGTNVATRGNINSETPTVSQVAATSSTAGNSHGNSQYSTNRAQLQYLNEQLNMTRMHNFAEKAKQGELVEQDQILRLLANQFPDLVVPSNSVFENSNTDSANWTVSPSTASLSKLSAEALQRRHSMQSYYTDSLNSSYSYDSFNNSNLSSGKSQMGELEPRRGTLVDQIALERRAQMELLANRSDAVQHNCTSPLMNNVATISRRNVTDYNLGPRASDNSYPQETLNALANLINISQLENNSQLPILQTLPQNRTNVLTSLLASLQERKPNMCSTPARELPRPFMRSFSDNQEIDRGSINVHQTSSSSLNEELLKLAAPYQRLLGTLENDIDHAANVYRNSASTIAQKSEAAYHWSGRLPVRVYRSMTFSRKVFLGGVPWDSTSDDLIMAFSRFGNVTVSWPQQDGHSPTAIRGRVSTPKGYCYLIFDHESSVNELLAACYRDPNTGGDYYKISSTKFKAKDVQIIPWVISDSQYTKSGPYRPDSKRTVFIGALHGMITAEALVTIMNDLFGNVVFAALDTDKYKYPIGSGRVAFSSHKSYMRAVTANFVDVRTSKFVKTIQIDPYLEDSLCNYCSSSPGIYFCRAFECFRYFCPACWQLWHNNTETLFTHKPLRRTFKPVTDRTWSMLSKF